MTHRRVLIRLTEHGSRKKFLLPVRLIRVVLVDERAGYSIVVIPDEKLEVRESLDEIERLVNGD